MCPMYCREAVQAIHHGLYSVLNTELYELYGELYNELYTALYGKLYQEI